MEFIDKFTYPDLKSLRWIELFEVLGELRSDELKQLSSTLVVD